MLQQAVPQPEASAMTPKHALASCTSIDRSIEWCLQETLKTTGHRLIDFLQYADKYKLPFSHAELKAQKNGPGIIKYLNSICSELEIPGHCSHPFSAQYFDCDEKPLLFYLVFGGKMTT